jgi:acetyltransferase EpsM
MEADIILYGASGHSKVIIDLLKACGRGKITVVDLDPSMESMLGCPVARQSEFKPMAGSRAIIAIGENSRRKKVASETNVPFATGMHPSSAVSPSAVIGEGSVVMANASVNADAVIGRHCIVNTGAIVEHDARVGDFAHISPGAKLAGNVAVGEGTQVGIGAAVIQGVTIGKWATIGAGAVIIRDIPDHAVVVGNPGRIIKYNSET